MGQKELQVAIIGAGPAGSSAAFFLARSGIQVTIFEKSVFPRDKICGDGLSARAFYTLFRMGVTDTEPLVEKHGIEDVIFYDWYGRLRRISAFKNLFGHGFCTISRRELDQILIRKATEAGAFLKQGVHIQEVLRKRTSGFTLIHSEGEEDYDILIGSDGANSIVRSSVFGLRRSEKEKAFGMRAYIRNTKISRPNSYHFIYLPELFPGYGWIFPLPNGRANIGFGLSTKILRRKKMNPYVLWERFLEHPFVKSELNGGIWESAPKGHHIPMKVGKEDLYQERAYLCGDAAGLVDPITGDGIDFALESGALVAEDIISSLQEANPSQFLGKAYMSRCELNIRKRLRQKERMKFWFYKRWIFDLIFKKNDKGLGERLLSRALLGLANPKEILQLLLGR